MSAHSNASENATGRRLASGRQRLRVVTIRRCSARSKGSAAPGYRPSPHAIELRAEGSHRGGARLRHPSMNPAPGVAGSRQPTGVWCWRRHGTRIAMVVVRWRASAISIGIRCTSSFDAAGTRPWMRRTSRRRFSRACSKRGDIARASPISKNFAAASHPRGREQASEPPSQSWRRVLLDVVISGERIHAGWRYGHWTGVIPRGHAAPSTSGFLYCPVPNRGGERKL